MMHMPEANKPPRILIPADKVLDTISNEGKSGDEAACNDTRSVNDVLSKDGRGVDIVVSNDASSKKDGSDHDANVTDNGRCEQSVAFNKKATASSTEGDCNDVHVSPALLDLTGKSAFRSIYGTNLKYIKTWDCTIAGTDSGPLSSPSDRGESKFAHPPTEAEAE